MAAMLSSSLCAASLLLAFVGMSSAYIDRWINLDSDPMRTLKKIDEMQQTNGMNPKGSIEETHKFFSRFARYAQYAPYRDGDMKIAFAYEYLGEMWISDDYDCRDEADKVAQYYEAVKSNPSGISKAFGDYVVFLFERIVEHCTKRLTANNWKYFFQIERDFSFGKYKSERKEALKLMKFDISNADDETEMFNRLADRVRELNKKRIFKGMNKADIFMDVGKFVHGVFSNLNGVIPEDAPEDVKKLHLLSRLWNELNVIYANKFREFFRHLSPDGRDALKIAVTAPDFESAVAMVANKSNSSEELARKTIGKACESVDKKTVSVANLIDALALVDHEVAFEYIQMKAVIFCAKMNFGFGQ